jgi:hypothetical protein
VAVTEAVREEQIRSSDEDEAVVPEDGGHIMRSGGRYGYSVVVAVKRERKASEE